jgi:hypothetical protein
VQPFQVFVLQEPVLEIDSVVVSEQQQEGLALLLEHAQDL